MRRAQRRMTRKRQLARRREDAHVVIGASLGGRQHERGLGQVGPVREALHGGIAQALRIEHHRHRVAAQRRAGKDIDHLISTRHVAVP